MRAVIVGEAGERPWLDGPSSRRLWRWFNVNSHDELASIATLMNVYTTKDATYSPHAHIQAILAAIDVSDVAFLVGRVAQSLIDVGHEHREVLWRDGKIVGLPHPSGLNRQLNDLSDDAIIHFIEEVWRDTQDMGDCERQGLLQF